MGRSHWWYDHQGHGTLSISYSAGLAAVNRKFREPMFIQQQLIGFELLRLSKVTRASTQTGGRPSHDIMIHFLQG